MHWKLHGNPAKKSLGDFATDPGDSRRSGESCRADAAEENLPKGRFCNGCSKSVCVIGILLWKV